MAPDDFDVRAELLLSDGPPAGLCWKHDVPRTGMVTEYVRQAQSLWSTWRCPLCAFLDVESEGGLEAVYDGGAWIVGRDLDEELRRQFLHYLTTRAGLELVDDPWPEVCAQVSYDDRQPFEPPVSVWLYAVLNPGIDVATSRVEMARANSLQSYGSHWPPRTHPAMARPVEVRSVIEESRRRWETCCREAWARLGPAARDSLASLIATDEGHLPLSRLELVDQSVAADFDRAVTEEAFSGRQALDMGDLRCWGIATPGSNYENEIRALACYARELGHPVPSPSPLVDPVTRPRFGPRTQAVEEVLTRMSNRTPLQTACVVVAQPDPEEGLTEAELWDDDGAVRRFYDRRLLKWAYDAALSAVHEVWGMDEGDCLFDQEPISDRDWRLYLALRGACVGELARDCVSTEAAERLGVAWRSGIAVAGAIAAAGPEQVVRALEIAESWDRPSDLAGFIASVGAES